MKALVVNKFGDVPDVAVEERAVPVPKPGYSLVRMCVATVNQLSHTIRSGNLPMSVPPLVLSNDGAGIITQSERYPAGTRVALFGGGELGITEDGLQQQYVLVENKRLIPLSQDMSLEEGAALPVNYITALQALRRVGNVSAGQKVLIADATGAVGHALIQTARALGAETIALVTSAARIALAENAGAHHVVDLSSGDSEAAIHAITEGQGVDLAFDPVGGKLLGKLMKCLRVRGTAVSIGFVSGTSGDIDLPDLVINEKRLLGYDAWLETDEDIAGALTLLQSLAAEGKLRPVIDSIYPLEESAEAYQRLTSRKATGTILLKLNDGDTDEHQH